MAGSRSEMEKVRRQILRKYKDLTISVRSGHTKIFRDGQLLCVIPGTPGGGRAWSNIRSQLRKAGIEL